MECPSFIAYYFCNWYSATKAQRPKRPARFTRHTSGGEDEYKLNNGVFSLMRLRRIKKAIIKSNSIILVPLWQDS